MRVEVDVEVKIPTREDDYLNLPDNYYFMVTDNDENELETEIVSWDVEETKGKKSHVNINLAIEITEGIENIDEYMEDCKFILMDDEENEYKAKFIEIHNEDNYDDEDDFDPDNFEKEQQWEREYEEDIRHYRSKANYEYDEEDDYE